MPKGRLVFDGDNIYTEKDARIYKLKSSISSKIDGIPGVVDSLDSTSATDALSANMGRSLQDQINSLSGTGKFLSAWNCTTGLPGTNPQEDPYTYKVGDYYVVSVVGATNYKPHGGTFTQGVPSTTVETENVGVNDKYYFDGADWVRIPDTSIQISIDSALSTSSTNAVENRAIANAINTKQDTISDLSTIRTGAGKGATALQPNDNITQLTNNAGYQTAGDVASAIQAAVGQLTTVNDGTLTIQKNSTSVGTFTANQAGNSTINITVPTAVTDLSDASDYATKSDVAGDLADYTKTSDLGAVALSNDYNDLNNKPTIPTVNNATLTIQKNSANVATFTANASSNVTANISVPTTVAELSDASSYATKADLNSKIITAATAPQSPSEGMLWYDTTNDVLKTYDGTNWNIVGGDLSNYLAKDNTTSYTPSGNYNPATKKYVDDSVAGTGIIDLSSSPRPSAAYYNGRIGFNSGNFYGSDGSDWKEISYKNVFCEYVPGVGASVDNLVRAQWYSAILLSFNESMSDKWIVTDLTWPNTDLGTTGKITAIGYVEEGDATFLQDYGFTEWPKGVTILEITWDWDSNNNEYVCTNLRFIPSSIVSGGTFGAFARECLAYGTEHKTTLHKYSTGDGSDRGTATYTMQGMGIVTGRGWSANNGTVSIAINGLTVWSENNSAGSHSFKFLNTPMTLSPGDVVSVTMSATNNGDVYADISDFY